MIQTNNKTNVALHCWLKLHITGLAPKLPCESFPSKHMGFNLLLKALPVEQIVS